MIRQWGYNMVWDFSGCIGRISPTHRILSDIHGIKWDRVSMTYIWEDIAQWRHNESMQGVVEI